MHTNSKNEYIKQYKINTKTISKILPTLLFKKTGYPKNY